MSGERNLTTRAFVTMVAVDGRARPTSVPRLEPCNDEERGRIEAAGERRRLRLAGRRRT